jgi:hypothetical protein
MPIPAELREKIELAIRTVEENPQHHLEWPVRRELYTTRGSSDYQAARKKRGWLAVASAEHVYPSLTGLDTALKNLPEQLLNIEKLYLNGSASSKQLHDIFDTCYHSFGHWPLLKEWDPSYSDRAYAAVTSIYKAASEIQSDLDYWKFSDQYAAKYGSTDIGLDIDWACTGGIGDAAGSASIAYACDPQLSECDTAKLKEFWIWWLTEAWTLEV